MGLQVEVNVIEKGKNAPQYSLNQRLSGDVEYEELFSFTKRSLISIARTVLEEEQSRGFDKDPVVRIDGQLGRTEDQVSPLGKIEYTARQSLNDVILDLFDAVEERSPVATGFYKAHNFLLFNGKSIGNTRQQIEAWINSGPEIKDADILQLIDIAPYASKLERQGTTASKRGLNSKQRLVKSRDKRQRSGEKVRAPNGTYFLASRSLKRFYGANVQVRFEFINGSSISADPGLPTSDFSGKKLRTNFASRSGAYTYPSIRIFIRADGVL